MATIPIEVILQDAESPVTPTPESGGETNITVPDTGTISNVGSNSGGIGSSASIILPAIIAILAIGAIVAMLVHKHRKHTNSAMSKKEKLATAASGTIAILAATILVGNLVIPATKAATSDITDGITPAEDKVSIVVTRDGGVAEASIESTAAITSTSDFGYKVLLSMAEGVETSNLYLDGDTTSQYYIAPVEAESEEGVELADDTWGFALTEDGEYSTVPLVDNPATVAQGDEPVEDELLSINYGVKVSSDLPAGTYSGGEIEYNFVTLEPSNISELTYMQDFAKLSTDAKTSVLRSMTEDEPYYLKDNRDNKTYHIAKLKDGNVWMTQNLDLQKEDLLPDVVLDTTNTNNPAADFTLPTSQTSGNEDWIDYDNLEYSFNVAHIYSIEPNTENPYRYCTSYLYGDCTAWGDIVPTEELGNLYNWYAATAGTGTYDVGSGEKQEAIGSICPSGWRLTNNSKNHEVTDYSNLFYRYGVLESPISSSSYSPSMLTIYEAPLSFIPAGYYGEGLIRVGCSLNIWSSLAETSYYAYSLGFGSNGMNPWGYYTSKGKNQGYSVRCIAK